MANQIVQGMHIQMYGALVRNRQMYGALVRNRLKERMPHLEKYPYTHMQNQREGEREVGAALTTHPKIGIILR